MFGTPHGQGSRPGGGGWQGASQTGLPHAAAGQPRRAAPGSLLTDWHRRCDFGFIGEGKASTQPCELSTRITHSSIVVNSARTALTALGDHHTSEAWAWIRSAARPPSNWYDSGLGFHFAARAPGPRHTPSSSIRSAQCRVDSAVSGPCAGCLQSLLHNTRAAAGPRPRP